MTDSGDVSRCPRCGAPYAPEHRFCGSCGAEVSVAPAPTPAPGHADAPQRVNNSTEELDRIAGAPYDPSPLEGTATPRVEADSLPYYIPYNRVILLSVLSAGLYIFFWMYVTWRHYRDHTGENVYPVFHALSLMVPVYQFFRLHAHMRVYQELMETRGVPSTLSPLRAVGIYFGVVMLEMVAFRLLAEPTLTELQQIAYFTVNVVQIIVLTWLVAQAQGNLNRFWQRRLGTQLKTSPVSLVEIALVVLGLLEWGLLIIILIDPSLLPADPSAGT